MIRMTQMMTLSLAALAILLPCATPASADITYTLGLAHGFGYPDGKTTYDVRVAGTNSAGTSQSFTGSLRDGSQTEQSFVQASPYSLSLLRTSAAASSVQAIGSGTVADAYSATEYRDVIHLTGGENLPASIRLRFDIDGNLAVSGPSVNGNTVIASLGMAISPNFSDDFTTSTYDSFGIYAQASLGNFITGGFSSTSGTPESFTGTVFYDAPYNAQLDGYVFNVMIATRAQALSGTATADFSHTAALSAITNTDGSALQGYTLTSDSGLQFGIAAVPEPPSLVLAGSGMMVMLGLHLVRAGGRGKGSESRPHEGETSA